MTILQVASMTEDEAREYLEGLRWPNGPVCPHCGSDNVTRMEGKSHRKGCIQCNSSECRKQFTIRVGSVLESSKVSLVKWVLAFHLLCSSKKGFSALQLQRELGLGSYKTAWFMLHRIRYAMQNETFEKPLEGVVEVDETYVGGKPRNKGTSKRGLGTKKQPVAVLVERGGRAVTGPVRQVTSGTMRRVIVDHVVRDATIFTDENSVYRSLNREFADHEAVSHKRREYARRRADGLVVSTNTAESFFALIKRGHYGVYHFLSKHHLHRYCAEFGFRWNHREISDSERREAAIRQAEGCRLMYA